MDTDSGGRVKRLAARYDIVSILIATVSIATMVSCISLYPIESKQFASWLLRASTGFLGAPVQVLALLVLFFLGWVCTSKYGNLRLGSGKPEYSTFSWIVMMLVCSQGAGSLYWFFSEWAYHFLMEPQLYGTAVSEAMRYEQSIAFTMFHWGPSGWALMCAFVLPYAYHYYGKGDTDARLSRVCMPGLSKKLGGGLPGRLTDLLFVFVIVATLCMTAALGTSIVGPALAELTGISPSFSFRACILVAITAFFALFAVRKDQSGLQKITTLNVYVCMGLFGFILIAGPTQFIIDSTVNSFGIMLQDFFRMALRTDPIGTSGHPQTWTVFYYALWLVYGPYMGLFVTLISRGRKVKEVIPAMILSGTLGSVVVLGIAGGYQEFLRLEGILDIPAMLASGQGGDILTETFKTLPLSSIVLVIFTIIVVLFLASSLEACSLTLASATCRGLRLGELPPVGYKIFWRFMLIALPLAMGYIGTDIDTVKSLSAVVGLALAVILCLMYAGMFKEVRTDTTLEARFGDCSESSREGCKEGSSFKASSAAT